MKERPHLKDFVIRLASAGILIAVLADCSPSQVIPTAEATQMTPERVPTPEKLIARFVQTEAGQPPLLELPVDAVMRASFISPDQSYSISVVSYAGKDWFLFTSSNPFALQVSSIGVSPIDVSSAPATSKTRPFTFLFDATDGSKFLFDAKTGEVTAVDPSVLTPVAPHF